MTREEKRDRMLFWFSGLRFDDTCQKEYIEWFNKMVSENIKEIKSGDVNSDRFKSAYMFLYNIKKYLENYK